MIEFVTRKIPCKLLEHNVGQISGVPRNPRRCTSSELDALQRSIANHGDLLRIMRPIVYPWHGRYVVLSGNQRLTCCQRLGSVDIDCDVLADNTPAAIMRQIAILSNRQAGVDDLDLLAMDWDLTELNDLWPFPEVAAFVDTKLLQAVDDESLDDVDSLVPSRCQLGDVWLMGDHRLLCGDATSMRDMDRLMSAHQADLLVTDPPYNVDYEGGTGLKIANDHLNDSQFLEFLTSCFCNANSVMRPGAAYYIWHADSEGYNFRAAARNAGWKVRQCLIWNKNSFVLGRQDYHWKHEPCLYGWTDGGSHYFVDDRSQSTVCESPTIHVNQLKRCELERIVKEMLGDKISTTVINEDRPSRSEEHPTMKPVKLLARLIRNSSQQHDIVLDFCGGSGSTLIACEMLHRQCRMMELDPHYCDVIIHRWERVSGQIAALEE